MASIVRWKGSARATNPVTVLSTGLSAMASNAMVVSAAVNNDSTDTLDLYADLELKVTYAVAPTENSLMEVYCVRQIDGSNYEDSSTEGRPKLGFVGGFVLNGTTVAQRMVMPRISVPPLDHKWALFNKGGQALTTSTGHTFKGYYYTEQTV